MKWRMKALVFTLVVALAVFLFHLPAPTQSPRAFEAQALAATGALMDNNNVFHCSGTEIGHDATNGYFLTARHCVADYTTNELDGHLYLSFSGNEKGPYYDTKLVALSLTDDIAILQVINGADLPEVDLIGNENVLHAGDAVFNASFPLGMGKLLFHGEFMAPKFEKIDERMIHSGWGPQWMHAMPMNLTIAHGSSGSGVFSSQQHALIGVAVGMFNEGSFAIAIPASRIKTLLLHLSDNTVEKFQAAHPPITVDLMQFLGE